MDCRAIIQSGIDYIEDNLKAEITAAELAKQAGFSLYHYYRLFQQTTGMPVMQYILRRRLLHAIYSIRCGNRKTSAALEYGFDTYAGFYKAFQREFGCTPSCFLLSHRARQPYRLNLFKEEHMIITQKKASEILKHWNMSDQVVSNIYYEGSGNINENAYYIGDSHVLKFTTNPENLKKHAEFSSALGDLGLCAADLIPTADGREYVTDGELYFYLTNRLSGKQIVPRSLYDGNCAVNARFIGEIIGQLHLALSRIDVPVNDADLSDTIKNWALPRSREILCLSDEFCREYIDSFCSLYSRLPRQIIHRDPNPGNIICDNEKWGFIDFDLSERNARIYDPCYAATAVLSETFAPDTPDANEKWLDIYRNIIRGYDSVIHLTDEEHKAIPCMLIANQLVCVAWFADQEKFHEIFEINKKMTLWLVSVIDQLKEW